MHPMIALETKNPQPKWLGVCRLELTQWLRVYLFHTLARSALDADRANDESAARASGQEDITSSTLGSGAWLHRES
jgi:hypothetical protein